MNAAHRALTIAVARGWVPWLDERDAVLEITARTEAGSRIRQAIDAHAAHLPMPECGQMVRGASGRTYWVDKFWRAQRVIGEDDGMLKYLTGQDLIKEKLRQEDLESTGHRIVRCCWHDVNTDPGPWLARLRRALASGAQ